MKDKYYIIGGIATLGAFYVYMKYKRDKDMYQYNSFLGWLFPKEVPKNITNNILFIGDSITDIDDPKGRPTGTYPLLIAKDRPDLSIDVNALAGKTTSWMLLNLPPYLRSKKYAKVFIYGGVNDAFSSTRLESVVANVQRMVDLAVQNGAEAYVVLGYEPNGFMDFNKMPVTKYIKSKRAYIPLIQRYKDYQNMLASRITNATIIPKIILSSKMTSDGIHPTGTGQRAIAETLKRYL